MLYAPSALPPRLQSIRNSSRYTDDLNTADFIFVDMHCYHSAWMAWLHPLNEEGRKLSPSPEFYIKRAFTKMQGMRRYVRGMRVWCVTWGQGWAAAGLQAGRGFVCFSHMVCISLPTPSKPLYG